MNRITPTLINHEDAALFLARILNRADHLVTIAEAATMRGCSVQNFSQLVHKGRLRSFALLGKRVVKRADVIAYNHEHPFNSNKITRRGKQPKSPKMPSPDWMLELDDE